MLIGRPLKSYWITYRYQRVQSRGSPQSDTHKALEHKMISCSDMHWRVASCLLWIIGAGRLSGGDRQRAGSREESRGVTDRVERKA